MPEQGVAVIITNHAGSFLLHLRDEKAPSMANEWCLVGGKVEEGESTVEAARREVLEETGLVVTDITFFASFVKNDSGNDISVFTAVTVTRDQTMVLGEGKELRFFPKADALALLVSISNKNQYLQTLEEFLKGSDTLGE